jgi:hypothetical protein
MLRWRAIEYLERHQFQVSYEKEWWLQEWIGDAAKGFVDVRSIGLKDATQEDLWCAARFPELQVLRCESQTLSDDDFRAMPAMGQLKEVYLYGDFIGLNAADWLSRSQPLDWVVLYDATLSDQVFERLGTAPRMDGLLIGNCTGITAEGVARLASVPGLRDFGGTPELFTHEMVEELHHFASLEYVMVLISESRGPDLDPELEALIEARWIIEWK